jgi:hypothetical protein
MACRDHLFHPLEFCNFVKPGRSSSRTALRPLAMMSNSSRTYRSSCSLEKSKPGVLRTKSWNSAGLSRSAWRRARTRRNIEQDIKLPARDRSLVDTAPSQLMASKQRKGDTYSLARATNLLRFSPYHMLHTLPFPLGDHRRPINRPACRPTTPRCCPQ